MYEKIIDTCEEVDPKLTYREKKKKQYSPRTNKGGKGRNEKREEKCSPFKVEAREKRKKGNGSLREKFLFRFILTQAYL